MNKTDLIKKRADYLADNQRTGGVVIINKHGESCGWTNKLRDPQSWEPGCIAVEENSNCWTAIGGNAYDGATYWQLINDEPEPEAAEQQEPAAVEQQKPRGYWIPEPMISNMSVDELRRELQRPLNYMTLQLVARRLLVLAERAEEA